MGSVVVVTRVRSDPIAWCLSPGAGRAGHATPPVQPGGDLDQVRLRGLAGRTKVTSSPGGAWQRSRRLRLPADGGTTMSPYLKLGLGAVAGLVVGGGVTLVGAGAWAYVRLNGAERAAARGLKLEPVVVVSQDVSSGATVAFDMLSQRPMPFASSSFVKPDSASYVVGQKVVVPLKAGDPLHWGYFAAARRDTKVAEEAVEACFAALEGVPGLPRPAATPGDVRDQLLRRQP